MIQRLQLQRMKSFKDEELRNCIKKKKNDDKNTFFKTTNEKNMDFMIEGIRRPVE